MKKNLITKVMAVAVVALLMLSNVSFAGDMKGGSENSRFSAGVELALPNGSFGDNSSTGFGLSLRYEMPMGDNLALMGTVGYITFGAKTLSYDYPGLFSESIKTTNSMIPIQVGAKYYFTEQQKGFYGAVHLGVHMLSTKNDVTVTIGGAGTSSSSSASSTALSYAPELGYHLDNIDFGLRYQLFSESVTAYDPLTGAKVGSTTASASYIGLRVAYVFGSK